MTTNYISTFIAVAPDCPAMEPTVPPTGSGTPTIAALQFDLIIKHPYEMTSDEIIFAVHAIRTGIPESEVDAARTRFFAKDQACLRASPLGKRYGWGTHHDENGRVALVGVGTPDYERLSAEPEVTHKFAMRSARA